MNPESMNDEQLGKALGLEYTAWKKAEKQFKELQSEWYSRHGREVGAEHAAHGVRVYLAPNRRWDEATARRALAEAGVSERVIRRMESTVLDREKAQEMLPPRIYKECQVDHAPKFMVKFEL